MAEALASFTSAVQAGPEEVLFHWNRAILLLLLGDYEQGLAEYEWRLRRADAPPRVFAQPRWDGSPLAGRTILLYGEPTELLLGDTIQFVRYARLLKEQGGTVIVECPRPLLRLLSRCPGIDHLVGRGDPLPAHDVRAHLMSLAYLFRTRVDTIPAPIPYLEADAALVEQWRRELASVSGFKIGIAWNGSSKADAGGRSLPVTEFAPLAVVPRVRLISLQKGPGSEQLAEVAGRWPVTDLGDRLDETAGAFMDTAAVMKNLDLVVTCDTSIGHLAGALGVPVWVALPKVPYWCWMLEREDTPWYPTMRLFRQEQWGDWGPVFERMARVLRERL